MLGQLRKGQSTMEYAIVIGLVIAAALGMQVYVRRGLQGKMKDVNDIPIIGGGAYGIVSGGQYEPDIEASGITTTLNASEKMTVSTGGRTERHIEGIEQTTRGGTETVSNYEAPPAP